MSQILDRNNAVVNQPKHLIQNQQTAFPCCEHLFGKVQTVFDVIDLLLLAFVRELCKLLLALLKAEDFDLWLHSL